MGGRGRGRPFVKSVGGGEGVTLELKASRDNFIFIFPQSKRRTLIVDWIDFLFLLCRSSFRISDCRSSC